MPKSSIQRQRFAQKKPYLIAAVFSLALAVFLLHVAEARIYAARQVNRDDLKTKLTSLTKKDKELTEVLKQRDTALAGAQGVTELAEDHFYWMNVLGEMRAALLRSETNVQASLKEKNQGHDVDVGVWVETFEPDLPAGSAYGGGKPDTGFQVYKAPVVRTASALGDNSWEARNRRLRTATSDTNGPRGGAPLTPQQIEAQKQKQLAALEAAKALSNSVTRILVTCRMVNRDKISGSANQDLAFAVQSNLMASPSFSTNVLLGTNGIKADPADTNTATFDLTVGLKNPLKL